MLPVWWYSMLLDFSTSFMNQKKYELFFANVLILMCSFTWISIRDRANVLVAVSTLRTKSSKEACTYCTNFKCSYHELMQGT